MDLDKTEALCIDKALREKTLDTMTDDVLLYGDLYADIRKEALLFFESKGEEKTGPVLVDATNILSFDGDQFVAEIYRRLLLREASTAELAGWRGRGKNPQDKALLLLDLEGSEEARKNHVWVRGLPEIRAEYLLRYDDKEFIENLYVKLLRRLPDCQGFQSSLASLRIGISSKEEIIHHIRYSAEGEQCGVQVWGLAQLHSGEDGGRLSKIPLIGKKLANYREELHKVSRAIHAVAEREVSLEEKLMVREAREMSLAATEEMRLKLMQQMCEENERRITILENAIDRLQAAVSSSATTSAAHDSQKIADEKEAKPCEKQITPADAVPSQPVVIPDDTYTSIDYFEFENHFRGSREHIKEVQEIYLPYFSGKSHVLDLGCGRGEFTELLSDRGIGVTGVDLYGPYVEYMKNLDLPVVQDDILHFLSQQEHTDGIFCCQVVEHLSVAQILSLLRLAYERLDADCCLVIETPNPMSLGVYASAFYIDPSHQKPIHPLTLKYFAEKAGFSEVDVLFTESSKMPLSIPKLREGDAEFSEFNEAMERLSNLLYGSQDYAMIARK